jgi:LPXTG-site transpeptidase (sortase) family protein
MPGKSSKQKPVTSNQKPVNSPIRRASRNQRLNVSTLRKRGVLVPVVAIICGLVLIQAPKIRMVYQAHVLQPAFVETAQVLNQGFVPVTLSLPQIIELEVEAAVVNDGYSVSQTKATYLPVSSGLGGGGNVIVYGHNLDWILGRLWRVNVGDEIAVYDKRGKVWNYQVTDKVQIKPGETQWLEPTETEVLTIYTCAGFMDRDRLVVRGELMADE